MEPKQETFLEKLEAFQQCFIFPAMTVLPVVRRRMGLRSLKGFYFWLPLAIMAFIGVQFSKSHALTYFAAVVAIAALWQRRNRWKEIRSGELWHTRSLGVCLWEFLPDIQPPVPKPGEAQKPPSPLLKVGPFFQTDRRLYRWIDPLCIFAIGLALLHFDPVFGGWIMFAAISIRVTEEYVWEKSIEAMLDQYDGLITAEQQNEALQELRRGHPTTGADGVSVPRPAPAPPPKGVAEDLREQVAARKAEADAREAIRQREAMAAAETTAKSAEAMSRIKQAAETVKEVAEAVSAVRDAAHPPEPDLLILDRSHTSDTLVMVREEKTFITAAAPEAASVTAEEPPPALTNAAAPASLPPPMKQLAAPPEDEQD